MKYLITRFWYNLRISLLGKNITESIGIFLYMTKLVFKKGIVRTCLFRYKGTNFSINFTGTHDEFLLFKEIFIKEEYYIPQHGVVKNPIILDLGANVGYASIYFYCCYPNARIYAVEPSPTAYKNLVKNVSAIPNITALQTAILDADRTTYFYESIGKTISSSLVHRDDVSSRKIEIRGMSFKNLLSTIGVKSIEILKFDMEGGEQFLHQSDFQLVSCAIIGELHRDLIGHEKAESLIKDLETRFIINSVPLRKKHREIIYGFRKN